jgi:hypothetical protein
MAGGLSQLVAYGAQDVYLTGNPQITFFKTVYRRYTNFAIESIQQTINGSVGYGNKVSTQISRNGDLITDIVVEFVLTKSAATTPTFYCAEDLLQDVELEIGGQRIDKHYNDWFRTYDSLFRMNDDRANYRRMTDFNQNEPATSVKRFYVPLIFFFNQTPGLALPLIALQYHEVKLYFTLAATVPGLNISSAAVVNATATAPQMSVWVDYIFLDTQERTRFAQLPHEYLIEQLQFSGTETATPSTTAQASQNIRLNLNHPTKYLAWNFNNPGATFYGQYTALANTSTNYTVTGDLANTATFNEALAVLDSAKLQLNGQDRFATRKGSYFNKVQPYQTIGSVVPAGVYLYSFALKPAGRQPSGTCNFSRIDNATLSLTYKTCSVNGTDTISNVNAALYTSETITSNTATALTALNIYAKNYNVLRIMSGMGGLAYAS